MERVASGIAVRPRPHRLIALSSQRFVSASSRLRMKFSPSEKTVPVLFDWVGEGAYRDRLPIGVKGRRPPDYASKVVALIDQ